MTPYREILRLNSQGISQRNIAVSCDCSRNTVSKIIKRADEFAISWTVASQLSDGELRKRLFPDASHDHGDARKQPDYEYIHKEMAKSGVTLSLLWQEYQDQCRLNQEIPFQYSQFCFRYQQFAQKTSTSMRIPRKPGEQLEVDWAGQTFPLMDRDTGELVQTYLFVGVLAYSKYVYAEAFLSQNLESWVSAHVNMFHFFGGATRILIPDNLKTGVEKASWYTPIINKTYHELAEHYDTAVIPARVRRPRDKPSVESAVNQASTWILAALRNQPFFRLTELNEAILEKLDHLNEKPFQKKEGSRQHVFFTEEKSRLLPLPTSPYELATWKSATVQINYHISIEKMHYSVPYEYARRQVDVRMTRNVIEVFYEQQRICSHQRMYGPPGQYRTVIEHMPEKHKQYVQWDGKRFVSWAESIGTNTSIVIQAMLNAHKVEQQSYRSCLALLKLSDKYGVERLERACAKALTYTPSPSFRSIKTILSTGQDQIQEQQPKDEPIPTNDSHSFVRGSSYYGRDHL